MGWGSLYKRRLKVCTLAIVIYLDYKALQQREKWTKKPKIDALWKKAHERNAKRVLNLMIELEGLWVKLGQYLSTRADVLPEAYINLLKQLQDSLPPRPLEEVYQTIEKELGKSTADLFLYFDKVPLATASIAQVHRATLRDGHEAVVKVQHDGVKIVILEDLKNAKSIADWIAWAEPQYNFNPMIDEWCKEVPKELDFNHEAENTRKVSSNLGCIKNSKASNLVDVLIPEVIQSTEKVLILEYMDGIRLNDSEALQALGVDKQKLVEGITRAYAHQIYVDGFFNGDPHPGNFLVSKKPPHSPILLDFGLTKLLPNSTKQALAKMFLASAEGDHVALLSAFSEMGLTFRLDIPEQAMEITNMFFRSSTPAAEAVETMKSMAEQREKNLKVLQEKTKLSKKEVKRFNPVNAFPGDIVIFGRVLNLLRGLSATLNVRIIYIDIMRPFAESVLKCNLNKGPVANPQWIYDTPILSDVEAKLRLLLVELGTADKILGIQVCAYKDGNVIIDTSAGVLGRYDPRPVQPDSLFSVFSVTKGITAGMLHWLVDKGKLRIDENVANIWPEFGSNGKDQIKVHHVLNHTSGLHNALADLARENPLFMSDWDESLNSIAMTTPETEPGQKQLYHYLSFGWLCGGIIERASGKRFQQVLEEVFIHPLKIEGELYIGVPPGVESRLATLTLDTDDVSRLSETITRPDLPSTFQPQNIAQTASALPVIFNTLNIRRAIIPSVNGHCSARALARYYAALVDGGKIPPLPPSSSSTQPLGTHPHTPKLSPPKKTPKKRLGRSCWKAVAGPGGLDSRNGSANHEYTLVVNGDSSPSDDYNDGKLFNNPSIHEAFLGIGEFDNLVHPNGQFGLGFKRVVSKDGGGIIGFGHSGIGGSTGFCDIKNRFAIAITLNKLSFGAVTSRIIELVCSELNIPVPDDISSRLESASMSLAQPIIN
ncbi:unnamed protein product [Cuscuta campestris]|uniref:Beta-lactamase-related domain-containing protein n=1 Tax=Cuscuta campestris TaxID=132261 RepID=A0A484K775_9ASTE|nr:unnamed protein product [Cuscuta campestris]